MMAVLRQQLEQFDNDVELQPASDVEAVRLAEDLADLSTRGAEATRSSRDGRHMVAIDLQTARFLVVALRSYPQMLQLLEGAMNEIDGIRTSMEGSMEAMEATDPGRRSR